jgi:hypothetical protein
MINEKISYTKAIEDECGDYNHEADYSVMDKTSSSLTMLFISFINSRLDISNLLSTK